MGAFMGKVKQDDFYLESLDIFENFLHLLTKKELEIKDLYQKLEELAENKRKISPDPLSSRFQSIAEGRRFTTIIADPISVMRVRLKEILSANCGCLIVGEVSNSEELLKSYAKHKPDLLVSDIELPTMDEGYEALLKIKEINPKATIIIVSRHVDDITLLKVMEIGAFDFILKPVNHVRLFNNVAKIRNLA